MNTHKHIDSDTLAAYLAGDLDPESLIARLVEELGRCCPSCRAQITRWQRNRPEPLPRDVRRQVEVSLELARAAAPPAGTTDAFTLVDDLLRLEPAQRLARIQANQLRHRSRLLIRVALRRVEECFPASPELALDRMDLAHALVMLYDGSAAEAREFQRNAAAAVYVLRSCAYRVRGSLALADHWLVRARSLPVSDARVGALLDEHEGALRLYQNRLDEADELLCRAIERHRRRQAEAEASRATVLLALVYREGGRLEEALSATVAAARGLHPADDPFAYISCQFLRGLVLCDLGDPEAAADLLEENRARVAAHWRHPTPLRIRWLEGRIAMGRSRHEQAVTALEEARRLALENDNVYDAALVSLDLALVHLDRFDWQALRAEAEAILPILGREELPRETAAALALHREALRRGRLEREALHRLATHLRAAQWGRFV